MCRAKTGHRTLRKEDPATGKRCVQELHLNRECRSVNSATSPSRVESTICARVCKFDSIGACNNSNSVLYQSGNHLERLV